MGLKYGAIAIPPVKPKVFNVSLLFMMSQLGKINFISSTSIFFQMWAHKNSITLFVRAADTPVLGHLPLPKSSSTMV